MNSEANYDAMPYRMFTQRSELEKAFNTLTGIIEGIALDRRINPSELAELKHWCDGHRRYANKHPFSELLPLLDASLEDNVLSSEEIEDIFWLIKRLRWSDEYKDTTNSALQRLHGLMHGILADNRVTDEEIYGLQAWIEEYDFLRGIYPYDEIDSLLTCILVDKVITPEERDMARAFFGEFVDTKLSLNVSRSEINQLQAKYSIKGICAVDPQITIPDSVFCLTGASARAQRKDIKSLIEMAGGLFSNSVNKKIHYLVVGAAGNPCWAFSCYGRKVEAAVELRKAGHKITILHECDLWDELIPLAESRGIDHGQYLIW